MVKAHGNQLYLPCVIQNKRKNIFEPSKIRFNLVQQRSYLFAFLVQNANLFLSLPDFYACMRFSGKQVFILIGWVQIPEVNYS